MDTGTPCPDCGSTTSPYSRQLFCWSYCPGEQRWRAMRPRNCYCCGELHGWKCPAHQGAQDARLQDVAWFEQHPDEDVLERELTRAETLNKFNLTSAVVNHIRLRRIGNKAPNTSPGWSIEIDRVWFDG